MMGYLDVRLINLIDPYVSYKTVWDLGCGKDAPHTSLFINLFSSKIVAVDKDLDLPNKDQITMMKSLFKDIDPPDQIDVAFLSWPINHATPGLVNILEKAEVIIYVGNNVDGNQCGNKELFHHLIGREVLECCPDRTNTLMVYGRNQRTGLDLYGEEKAFFSTERIMTFSEAHS